MAGQVFIAGARASQPLFGELFTDPSVVGDEESLPDVTFYDIDPAVALREDLPHLDAARREGRVRLVNEMPEGPFDIAVIATASANHASATQAIIDGQTLPQFFIQEKPLAATPEELEWFQRLVPHLPPNSITNEPYLFSQSVRYLSKYICLQKEMGNSLSELCAWSSKLRSKRNPHGSLGIFGIELPHTHGVASLLAGEVLGSGNAELEENTYFADVDGEPGNDGNYLRFRSNETTIHIAQGLGRFTMDSYGVMRRHEMPPKTRSISAIFADGRHVTLDMEPAFAPTSTEDRYGLLQYHDTHDTLFREVRVPDDPRRHLVRYAWQQVHGYLNTPLPHVSLQDSLARSEALLQLRASAEVRKNVSS